MIVCGLFGWKQMCPFYGEVFCCFFIYVLPLEINFFKILLYFKCIYIDIIFKQDALMNYEIKDNETYI
jgi:hypothetical protein